MGWLHPFVIVSLTELPSRPRPLKIGGLLAWFTDKAIPEGDCGPSHLLSPGEIRSGPARPSKPGCDLDVPNCDLRPWEMPSLTTLETIYDTLTTSMRLLVPALSWRHSGSSWRHRTIYRDRIDGIVQ